MDGSDNSDLMKRFSNAANEAPEGHVVRIDVEKYQHMLDDSGMSDAQKRETLEALWSLIVVFVDLGFGVHPVQKAYGQVTKELDPHGQTDSHETSPKDTDPTEGFNNTAPKQE